MESFRLNRPKIEDDRFRVATLTSDEVSDPRRRSGCCSTGLGSLNVVLITDDSRGRSRLNDESEGTRSIAGIAINPLANSVASSCESRIEVRKTFFSRGGLARGGTELDRSVVRGADNVEGPFSRSEVRTLRTEPAPRTEPGARGVVVPLPGERSVVGDLRLWGRFFAAGAVWWVAAR
jgi:hypothetical protein